MTAGKIYAAIAAVSEEAGALAPTKGGAGVPFSFRGVDATVAHVAPFLKKHGIIIVPEVKDKVTTSREVGNKVVTQTDLVTSFHFIHTEDGSEVVATTAGLAMDFADRSAAQAQSVAFRVAILQTFTLPTHDREPEEVGEEIIKGTATERAKGSSAASAPKGKSIAQLSAQIGKLISSGTVTADAVNAKGAEISKGKPAPEWKADAAVLQAVLDAFA